MILTINLKISKKQFLKKLELFIENKLKSWKFL